jgi:hypothetical protein
MRARALAIALLLVTAPAAHSQPESLPPDHWAYEELEHFEARGLLRLSGTRPYSRAQVRAWVESLAAASTLTGTEQQRLVRLEREFVRGAAPRDERQRFDPALVRYHESSWSILGDIEASGGASHGIGAPAGPEQDGTAWGRGAFDAQVHYGERVVYDTRYRVAVEEEEGQRTQENAVSARERNWRGFTANYDRAYIAFQSDRFRFSFGRDYLAWGATRNHEMLLAAHAQSFDGLQAHLRLGRLHLSTMTALLSSQLNRQFAAHRAEIDLGAVRVGLHETALYVSPHLEPAYLFPLGFYYGNQFNERGDDNVLLGFDVKWSSPLGVLAYEFLADDFIYDGDPAPNRLGSQASWSRGFAVAGTDLDVRLGYVAIGRWVFTHRDSAVAYIGGDGNIAEGDAFLGHWLGPDADHAELALAWSPELRWKLDLALSNTRRGDGNRDLRNWVWGDEHNLPFPSGTVERETWLVGHTRWLVTDRTMVSVGGGIADTSGGREARLEAEVRLDL